MSDKTRAFAMVLLAGAIWATAPAFAQEQEQEPPPPPPSSQDQPPAPSRWRRFGEPSQTQAPPPEPVPYSAPDQLVMPAGTWITMRVNQPLSSDHNVAGDRFNGTLEQPLVVNGYVVARRGQTLEGRVSEAVKAGRTKGTSRLGLEVTEIGLVDGQQMPVRTQLMEFTAGTSRGRDAAAIATTTGVGAAIGAAVDGGFGAGMGAIAGAAASTIGVLATRGQATEIYPEGTVTFRTLAPVTIYTGQSAQAFQPVSQTDYQPQRQLQHRVTATVAAPPPPAWWGYGYGYGYPYYYPYYPGYFYGPTIGIGFYGGGYRYGYGYGRGYGYGYGYGRGYGHGHR